MLCNLLKHLFFQNFSWNVFLYSILISEKEKSCCKSLLIFFPFLHPVYPLKSKMKILIFGPIFTRFLAFCPESRALYDGINKKLGAITKKYFFLKINFSSCFSSIFPHRSVATLPLINESAIFGFCVPKAFKWVPTIL